MSNEAILHCCVLLWAEELGFFFLLFFFAPLLSRWMLGVRKRRGVRQQDENREAAVRTEAKLTDTRDLFSCNTRHFSHCCL